MQNKINHNMTRRRFLKTAFAISGVAATGSLTHMVQAQEMRFFRIGTGGAGGTYFPVGGIIANAISNPPGSRPCDKGGNCGVPNLVAMAQSTTASVHNCNAVNAGDLEAGMTSSGQLYDAYHGKRKFANNPKKNLRFLANLFPEDMHLVMPQGTKLNGLADLKGKRVGIAEAGSGTQVAVELILGEYGLNRDNYDAAELNNAQSAQRIADGQLDAYFYAAGTPVAAIIQLDSTKGLELYSMTGDEVKAALGVLPYYVPSTIPAGVYPSVNYDVNTIAVSGMLAVRGDLPDELIYEVTQALWSKTARKLLDNGHAKGKVIRLETALKGYDTLDVPMHPGAERYYREQGLL